MRVFMLNSTLVLFQHTTQSKCSSLILFCTRCDMNFMDRNTLKQTPVSVAYMSFFDWFSMNVIVRAIKYFIRCTLARLMMDNRGLLTIVQYKYFPRKTIIVIKLVLNNYASHKRSYIVLGHDTFPLILLTLF